MQPVSSRGAMFSASCPDLQRTRVRTTPGLQCGSARSPGPNAAPYCWSSTVTSIRFPVEVPCSGTGKMGSPLRL